MFMGVYVCVCVCDVLVCVCVCVFVALRALAGMARLCPLDRAVAGWGSSALIPVKLTLRSLSLSLSLSHSLSLSFSIYLSVSWLLHGSYVQLLQCRCSASLSTQEPPALPCQSPELTRPLMVTSSRYSMPCQARPQTTLLYSTQLNSEQFYSGVNKHNLF